LEKIVWSIFCGNYFEPSPTYVINANAKHCALL
jgi:hypothetical protein